MKCPACQHDNTAGAKFCEQCATALSPAPPCPNCGWQVQSTANFCPQCGNALKAASDDSRFASPTHYTPQRLAEKILTTKSALEGERKQITVLFADIKGSMELLADRDPEDAQKLLDPVLERMIEAVHRYEGTVNRVMGDGIMALFGAPIAHEDHAVRACYAALRMQETVTRYADEVQRTHGLPVTIRVGLNSGEIVVCAIGNDLHMDYTVVGQTAHLAARMEQMAKRGSVLTTADTLDLEQLRRAQQLAVRSQAQVVALVGEAGVGKSRLVREFVHSQNAVECLVLESKSAAYSHAMPYLPVIELLRHYFQIGVHDSTQSIREKVTDKILTLDATLQDVIPPMLDLLDALADKHPFRSLDPIRHRQYTYQAVTRLLLSETRVQPVVAVFEDLHWHDSLSLGLLSELVVAAQHARFLLVVSYRPEYRDEWRNRPNYRQIRLDPLASESLAEFLQALVGPDPSLAPLKNFLERRASGNPFFAEEIVRRLVDTTVVVVVRGGYRLARPFSSTEVPPTVQAVLAARIDALPPSHKHLLQEAAVIGHEVPFGLLQAICGLSEDQLRGLLDSLQAAEFLYSTQLFPDLQYTFKHALTHDVTYSGVLHERRREIHARVVNAIEKLYSDRLGEQVERLADHAVLGQLNDKAVQYLRQAGAKAAARSALLDARSSYEKALDLLKSQPDSQAAMEQAFEIHLDLRAVLRQLGEVRQMLDHLRQAEALADRLKDDRRRGRVCAIMTTVLSTLDELDEALLTGTRAVEIAERATDLRLGVTTKSCLEEAYYYRGEYQRVVEIGVENLAALPAEWAHEYLGLAVPPSVFGRVWLVMSLAELGRFAEAGKYEAEAIQLAEPTQHTHTIGWAYLAASILHLSKGDWGRARSLIENWIGSRTVAMLLPWAIASSAWALAQTGDVEGALSRVEEAERLLDKQSASGIVGHRSWAYVAVSRACLLLERFDKARHLGDCSVASSQRQPGFRAHALHLLGDLAAHRDQFDAESGVAHYQQALALAQSHGMRPLVAHCYLGLSKLYRRAGKPEQAQENLTAATTMYREMDMGFWCEQGRLM